ncbi:MAG: serine hydrolase domain-containing protein [Pseudomonadota bacterium]
MIRPVSALLAAVFCLYVSKAGADPVASIRWLQQGTEVQAEAAFADAKTPFAIASIGKMMTAVAVLRVAERGDLGLEDAVVDWVPEGIIDGLAIPETLTIRQLLSMRSGLPDYLDDAFYDLDAPSAREALAHVYGEPLLFGPGEDFDYSNTNYVLLGLILEEATQVPYEEVMVREVFTPAGMAQAFVFGARELPAAFPNGHEGGEHVRAVYARNRGFGDGGVISSAQDLGRFLSALFVEQSLLSEGSLRMMLDADDYGLGVEIDGPIVGHSGGDVGFASDARVDLETGRIGIILVADGEAQTWWAEEAVR